MFLYNVRYRVDIRQDDDKEETKVIKNNDDNLKKKNEELGEELSGIKINQICNNNQAFQEKPFLLDKY